MRECPHLLRLRTFNEKVLHRMLFDRRSVLTMFCGKLESRDYVQQRVADDSLLGTITARNAEDLLRLELPDRFAVKANHMSGLIRFCDGTDRPDLFELGAVVEGWCRRRSALQWGTNLSYSRRG